MYPATWLNAFNRSNDVFMGALGFCLAPALFIKETHFTYCMLLASLSNPVNYRCQLISVLSFIPLVCVSVLWQYHTSLITVALNCVLKWEMWSLLTVLFQDCLAIQGLLEFHVNFRMGFSIFSQKALGILIAIALN